MFIFRRLKINHDTHEFILDSGTIANSTSRGDGNTANVLLVITIVVYIMFNRMKHGYSSAKAYIYGMADMFSDRF
jgi:hypothetical protein